MSSVVVLFDLDGTLIDSELVWDEGIRALAARRNASVGDELLRLMRGRDVATAIALVHEALAWRDEDIPRSLDWLQDYVRNAFRAGVIWLPGARELLTGTRKVGLRTGLVTSTYRALVEVVVGHLGPENFDVIVCGDDVVHPKPSPEPYLTAISALGADPADCVVVEDSSLGVASAQDAGCSVVLVGPGRSELSVDAQIGTLAEVDAYFLTSLVTRKCGLEVS